LLEKSFALAITVVTHNGINLTEFLTGLSAPAAAAAAAIAALSQLALFPRPLFLLCALMLCKHKVCRIVYQYTRSLCVCVITCVCVSLSIVHLI
jgi:hypothetical protein